MANQWFRLYSEFANDPKVQMLSETDQRRFIMVLCIKCSNGDVTLQDEEVAFQLRISNEEWLKTKEVFIAKNLISEDNKPVSWEKRQFASDSSAERVARHRERKNNQCNVTVTPQIQNRTDTEQNRTEKEKPSPVGDLFPGVSDQVIADFRALRARLKAPITKTAMAGIQREADSAGVSLELALATCCERGWRGFKAEWMNRASIRASPAFSTVGDKREQTIAALTGRDRPQNGTLIEGNCYVAG